MQRVRRLRLKWWHGVFIGAALMLSPGAAMLLLAFAAPAIPVALHDNTPHRATTRAVVLFLLAGTLSPARAYIVEGGSLSAALGLLVSPQAIATAWVFGGGGWLLSESFSLLGGAWTARELGRRRKALEREMLLITTEWSI